MLARRCCRGCGGRALLWHTTLFPIFLDAPHARQALIVAQGRRLAQALRARLGPERSVGVLCERRAHHGDDVDEEIQREMLVGAHLLVMLDDVGRRLDASHTDHREHKAPRVGTERALDSQQFAMRSSPYRREHEKI